MRFKVAVNRFTTAAFFAVALQTSTEPNDTPLQERIGPWLVELSADLERPNVPVICRISQASVRLTFYGGDLAQVELDRPASEMLNETGTNVSVRSLRIDRRSVRLTHRRSIPAAPDHGGPYINDPVTTSSFSFDGRVWRELPELPVNWRAARRMEVIGARGRRIALIELSRFADAAQRCGY